MATLAHADLDLPPSPRPRTHNSSSLERKISNVLCPGYISDDQRWRFVEKVGEGSFGVCFKAEDTTKPGAFAAFKIIKLTSNRLKNIHLEDELYAEYSVLRRIADEKMDVYSPKLHGLFREAGHLCIVMEYFEKSLKMLTNAIWFLDNRAMREFAHDIAQSLYGLHVQGGIIHSDVKPENILIRERPEPSAPIAFLADYGVSLLMDNMMPRFDPDRECGGTGTYTSPECWKVGHCQNAAADIWALGVTLLESRLGYHPLDRFFGNKSPEAVKAGLLSLKRYWFETEGLLDDMPDDMASFISQLLEVNPYSRITAKQILLHPFLATTRLDRQKYNLLRHNRLLHPHPLGPARAELLAGGRSQRRTAPPPGTTSTQTPAVAPGPLPALVTIPPTAPMRCAGIKRKAKKQVVVKKAQQPGLLAPVGAAEAPKLVLRRSAKIPAKGGVKPKGI
ncbi:kinase-like domain-containing protein [Morchella snyderi]|nr:kinase-like domain-containing protein [Morchella snyderi]